MCIYIYMYIYIIPYIIHTLFPVFTQTQWFFPPKNRAVFRQVKPVCEEIAVAVNAGGARMDQAVAPPIGWFTTPSRRSYG